MQKTTKPSGWSSQWEGDADSAGYLGNYVDCKIIKMYGW